MNSIGKQTVQRLMNLVERKALDLFLHHALDFIQTKIAYASLMGMMQLPAVLKCPASISSATCR